MNLWVMCIYRKYIVVYKYVKIKMYLRIKIVNDRSFYFKWSIKIKI